MTERQCPSLPPPEFRRFNPESELIPTPVDDRGIVKIGDLIAVVLQTVEPEYQWSATTNIHHFYWPRSACQGHRIEDDYADFRGLAVNKGYLPIDFHNWLHAITLPPSVPERAVMIEREAAFKLAVRALRHATQYVRLSTGLELIEQNLLEFNLATVDARVDSMSYSPEERLFLHESLNGHFEAYLEALVGMIDRDPLILPPTTVDGLANEETMEQNITYLRGILGARALALAEIMPQAA